MRLKLKIDGRSRPKAEAPGVHMIDMGRHRDSPASDRAWERTHGKEEVSVRSTKDT